MKKLGLVFVSALSMALAFSPVDAYARHGGRGGGHGGGRMRVAHFHGGHAHFHPGHFGGRRSGQPASFERLYSHGPRYVGRPYGWHGPSRMFVGGPLYRPYPTFAPRVGYGFGPGGCSTRRNVEFLPGGWRKIVTVRTCYVR